MSQQVRWGVLGAAGIARTAVIPAIMNADNAQVVAIASRSDEGARDLAESCGAENVYQSYDALIADPDVDAVYIPLPNSLHEEWTLKAARAGKAVLCEKPLALTPESAQRMVEECAKLGVPLMEGFMYQFHPQHQKVRDLIAAGAIGEVTEVQAHLSVDLMSPLDPKNVRFDPALGGGALLDMGCYTVHIARSFLGEPNSVRAWWKKESRFGVDIAAAGVLLYDDGRYATFSCSFEGNGQGFYRVIGRQGMIDVPRGIIPGLDTRIGETIVATVDADGKRNEEIVPAVDQYELMIEAYSIALLSGSQLPVDPQSSVLNMKCIAAIALSAAQGKSVAI